MLCHSAAKRNRKDRPEMSIVNWGHRTSWGQTRVWLVHVLKGPTQEQHRALAECVCSGDCRVRLHKRELANLSQTERSLYYEQQCACVMLMCAGRCSQWDTVHTVFHHCCENDGITQHLTGTSHLSCVRDDKALGRSNVKQSGWTISDQTQRRSMDSRFVLILLHKENELSRKPSFPPALVLPFESSLFISNQILKISLLCSLQHKM